MANEITPTQASSEIPQNWRPRFINALYEKQSVLPYVLNALEDFADHDGKGNIANISVEPTYTVNTTGSDGSLTVQQPSLTNVQVTVATLLDVTVEFTGITRIQAFKIWEDQFPVSAGNALRERIQKDVLALAANGTAGTLGDGTGNLGEDEILGAIQKLITAKVPIMENPESCCFAFADNQFAPIKKLGLLDFRRTGEAGDGGAATMDIPKLYGIPVVFSTQVAKSGSIRQNALFAKEAFAWAAQQNVEPRMTDRLAAAKDSWLMTVLAKYGVQTVVAGRSALLQSAA